MTEQRIAYKQLTDEACSGSHLETHYREDPRQERPRVTPGQLALAAEGREDRIARTSGRNGPQITRRSPAVPTVIEALREQSRKR